MAGSNLNAGSTRQKSKAFNIDKAGLRDLFAVKKHEKQCFSSNDAWTLLDMITVLSSRSIKKFKIQDGNRIIGFAAVEEDFSKSYNRNLLVAWLITLGVLPNYRNQGLGTKLLKACENSTEVQSMRLCVRKSNTSAIRLYRNNGYDDIGVWKNYYLGREDALIMGKNLTQT